MPLLTTGLTGKLFGRIRKWTLIGLGGVFAVAGFLTFWLPLPMGIPLLLIGFALLGRHSPHARLWLRPIKRRASRLWRNRTH
ncbi:hypothetical protein P8631_06555 [Guyparkeria sp. 1SP6A2]|nr:hypothetical protein [Guyparkeria sp. 1SP6A2]